MCSKFFNVVNEQTPSSPKYMQQRERIVCNIEQPRMIVDKDLSVIAASELTSS